MQTTVMLDKSTVQVLERLKGRYKARSYNDVIMKMAKSAECIPESRFGAHPELKTFKRDPKDFHEL